MNSIKKSLILACAASVLGFGVAVAQTDPAAPAMAPATGGDMTAPATDAGTMPKKPMKKMSEKKHMKKKKTM